MSDPAPPPFTSEQIQLARRLESVFMPQAQKQRDAFYDSAPNNPGPRFVHYTSAESALSIIANKRIWMRNATCMTDYREVSHGFDILAKFFSDKPRLDAFTAALDKCAAGVGSQAIALFNQWLPDIRYNTYITSISEHAASEDMHGRLSMWRAFGNSTARVALVFRIPKYSSSPLALNLLFSPVAYLTESEIHDTINDVIANIELNAVFLRTVDHSVLVNYVFTMLVAGVTCLKHEGFKEEREWRAIYSPKQRSSLFMKSSTKVVGGVPQVVYEIPIDATAAPVAADLDIAAMFDRLIIGPSPYPLAMAEAYKKVLSEAGVADVESKIYASLIPIRN